MSYALRNDGQGFRAVSGPDEVATGETFSATLPALVPTQAQIFEMGAAAVQSALDAGARAWGYDDIKTAVGYVGDPYPRFNAEAVALRNWRSAVWVWATAHQEAIVAGTEPVPASAVVFAAGMPALPSRPN